VRAAAGARVPRQGGGDLLQRVHPQPRHAAAAIFVIAAPIATRLCAMMMAIAPAPGSVNTPPIQSPIFNSLAVTSNGEPNVLRSSHYAQESTRDCCQRRDVVWLCPWVLGAHATR
jgi:hypothetical protein